MSTIIEVNCSTGETIERDMNEAELAQYLKDKAEVETETE